MPITYDQRQNRWEEIDPTFTIRTTAMTLLGEACVTEMEASLPDSMIEGALRYVCLGVKPGHFLTALFSNDLMESFKRADMENQRTMINWVQFLYRHAPYGCYGSEDQVKAWCTFGGLAFVNVDASAYNSPPGQKPDPDDLPNGVGPV